MRVSLQPAFILHRRSFQNTSWLLEVITPEYGLIPLVAKGVRRQNNEKRALLEPFTELMIGFSGRGELMTLTAAELVSPRLKLTGTGLYSGMYINELLYRLLHRNDPHEDLFEIYKSTLQALPGSIFKYEPALRKFELQLLKGLGYGLQLQQDVGSGEPIDPDSSYRYDLENGPIKIRTALGVGPVVSGHCLLALSKSAFADESLWPEMKKLMRYVVHHHLDGRPLKSRELFTKLAPVQ